LRTSSMYFWMALSLTRSPSFSSSPRMRSAPQVRFSWAIRLIKATISSASGGLPRFPLDLDLRFHTHANSARCHLNTVSGCAISSAFFHVRSLLDNSTDNARSRQVSFGRFDCRLSTINCWRRRAFSSTSSDLLWVMARAVLRTRVSLMGFVHWCNRRLTTCPRDPMLPIQGKDGLVEQAPVVVTFFVPHSGNCAM
jgi:hypothetical protein